MFRLSREIGTFRRWQGLEEAPLFEGEACGEDACAEEEACDVGEACDGEACEDDAGSSEVGAGRARLAVQRGWVPRSRWSFNPPVLPQNSGRLVCS